MTLVFPRVRNRQKRRPKGRRFACRFCGVPLSVSTRERIAGLLPAALAAPRQTSGAQQGGSGIERHACVRGLGAGVAAAGRVGIVVAAGGGGVICPVGVIVLTLGRLKYPSVAGTAVTAFPVHRSGDFSGEVIFSFRHQQNGIYIFFPLSNAVMVGKVLYISSSECHMATGSSFSFNSCHHSSCNPVFALIGGGYGGRGPGRITGVVGEGRADDFNGGDF